MNSIINNRQNSIVDSLVEVTLTEQEDFLKIKETLTRVGISSRKDKILYQSCHILHKQGKYYIVHFKELFALDGKPYNLSPEDKERRNRIAFLLEDWGLVKIVNSINIEKEVAPMSGIKILSHKEKHEWSLESKYNIGKKR